MNTYARDSRIDRFDSSGSDYLIKYVIWAVDVFAVLLAVYLIFRRFYSWFLVAPSISDNFTTLFGICIAVTAIASIPFFNRIEEYYENNASRGISAFNLSVIRVFCAGLVFAAFLATLMPHASTYISGKETIRTFEVEWIQGKGKNCSGYKIVGRSWLTHDRMCGLSSETKARINKTGIIEIKGVENAFGFRAIEKIT